MTKAWDRKGGTPTDYVVSHNLHRRHLSESQRAMIGAELKKHYGKQGKARQIASRAKPGQKAAQARVVPDLAPLETIEETGKARDKAAAKMNVSHGLVDAAVGRGYRQCP